MPRRCAIGRATGPGRDLVSDQSRRGSEDVGGGDGHGADLLGGRCASGKLEEFRSRHGPWRGLVGVRQGRLSRDATPLVEAVGVIPVGGLNVVKAVPSEKGDAWVRGSCSFLIDFLAARTLRGLLWAAAHAIERPAISLGPRGKVRRSV